MFKAFVIFVIFVLIPAIPWLYLIDAFVEKKYRQGFDDIDWAGGKFGAAYTHGFIRCHIIMLLHGT